MPDHRAVDLWTIGRAPIAHKLHSRDEIVFCPSCRRILYIPEDLTPEAAIHGSKPAKPAGTRTRASKKGAAGAAGADGDVTDSPAVIIEKRAKGQLGQILSSAQGESVQAAVVSGSNPVECEVYLDNELAGYYKGRDPSHLERNVRYRLEQVGKKAEVRVVAVSKPEEQPAAPEPESAASAQASATSEGEASSPAETSSTADA